MLASQSACLPVSPIHLTLGNALPTLWAVDTHSNQVGNPAQPRFVSRGGIKLAAALDHFAIPVAGKVCADLGSNVGGFVDCLLQRGALRVYSVDTSYGTLAWKLRKDPRVVVFERTNALHASLPDPVELVTIDVGWTRQAAILPNAFRMLAPGGCIITLIKPHYEAPVDLLVSGVLPDAQVATVVENTLKAIKTLGCRIQGTMESPIRGSSGNREVVAWLAHES